jgi:hypothetical protein
MLKLSLEVPPSLHRNQRRSQRRPSQAQLESQLRNLLGRERKRTERKASEDLPRAHNPKLTKRGSKESQRALMMAKNKRKPRK